MQFYLRDPFTFSSCGVPRLKPGNRIEIPLALEGLPTLSLSTMPLQFASLLIAFPGSKHQHFHADDQDGDRAIIYLTDVFSSRDGAIQVKGKKALVGPKGTGIFYSASTIHRGKANKSLRPRIALALAYSHKKVQTVGISIDSCTSYISSDFLTVSGTFRSNGASIWNNSRLNYGYQTPQAVSFQNFYAFSAPNYISNISGNGTSNGGAVQVTYLTTNAVSISLTMVTTDNSTVVISNLPVSTSLTTLTTGYMNLGVSYYISFTVVFTDGTYVIQRYDFDYGPNAISFQLTENLRHFNAQKTFTYSSTFSSPLLPINTTFNIDGGILCPYNFFTQYNQNMAAPKPTFQAYAYSSLNALGITVNSNTATLTSYSTALGEVSTSHSNVLLQFASLSTSLTDIKTSLSLLGGGGSSITEAQSFQLESMDTALMDYKGESISGLYPYFPTFINPESDMSFRPFYMNVNDPHFFTTSKLIRNNGLVMTNDNSTGALNASFTSGTQKDRILIDTARNPLTKSSAVRVFNDWEPTSLSIGTVTVATLKPAFSISNCSYSMFPEGPNMWVSSSCHTQAQQIQENQDLSTVYVFKGYSDYQSLSSAHSHSSIYWAFFPGYSLTDLTYGPELNSYVKYLSDTEYVLDPSKNPLQAYYIDTYNVQGSYFTPLIANEDSWGMGVYDIPVIQYSSRTGLSNFSNLSQAFLGSQTSLSFIGGFTSVTSLTDFTMTKNQFLFYRTAMDGNLLPYVDGFYFCAGTLCSNIAVRPDTLSSYTFHTDFMSLTHADLFTTYSLIKVHDGSAIGTALTSISILQSTSLYNHPFSLTSLTMITDAYVSQVLGDVQPQENLTFVNKSISTSHFTNDKYSKIPSILNPSNVIVNEPTYTPYIYANSSSVFQLWSSVSGPYKTVTVRLDSLSLLDYVGPNLDLYFNHSISSLTDFSNGSFSNWGYNDNSSKSVNIIIPQFSTFNGSFSFNVLFNDFPSTLQMSYTILAP